MRGQRPQAHELRLEGSDAAMWRARCTCGRFTGPAVVDREVAVDAWHDHLRGAWDHAWRLALGLA